MKSYILAVAGVLAAIAVVCDSAPRKLLFTTKCNVAFVSTNLTILEVGSISSRNRLLDSIQVCNFPRGPSKQAVFTGTNNFSSGTTITKLSIVEIHGNPISSAQIVKGGIGQQNIVYNVTSVKESGFYFQVDIWGR